jgi:hypothetical protein
MMRLAGRARAAVPEDGEPAMTSTRLLAVGACAVLAAAATEACAAEVVRPNVPALLASNDADRDGRLTLAELEGARERQMARFDGDADGRLSIEEYGAYWLDLMRERMTRQFRADDRDDDDQVTIEELKQRSAELIRRRDMDKEGTLTAEELRPRRRIPAG